MIETAGDRLDISPLESFGFWKNSTRIAPALSGTMALGPGRNIPMMKVSRRLPCRIVFLYLAMLTGVA